MPTEKTLELNLTHELLSLPHRLWASVHPSIPTSSVSATSRRYALGLTLREEKRQGWDVKIEIPASMGYRRFALFLQVKSGAHKRYSTSRRSAFKGSRRSPNPFCAFDFNDNSGHTQHVTLQTLAGQPGLRGAVMYAFPRITTVQSLKASVGRLIDMTSFLTVADLDAEMSRCGVTLGFRTHHFLTSYSAPFVREARSEPKRLADFQDSTDTLLADLIACKTYQILGDIQDGRKRAEGTRPRAGEDWNKLLRVFTLELAKYFALPSKIAADIIELDYARDEAQALDLSAAEYADVAADRQKSMPDGEYSKLEPAGHSLERRRGLLRRTVAGIKPYRDQLAAGSLVDVELLPPRTKALVAVHQGELTLSFESLKDKVEIDAFDQALAGISYQLV